MGRNPAMFPLFMSAVNISFRLDSARRAAPLFLYFYFYYLRTQRQSIFVYFMIIVYHPEELQSFVMSRVAIPRQRDRGGRARDFPFWTPNNTWSQFFPTIPIPHHSSGFSNPFVPSSPLSLDLYNLFRITFDDCGFGVVWKQLDESNSGCGSYSGGGLIAQHTQIYKHIYI